MTELQHTVRRFTKDMQEYFKNIDESTKETKETIEEKVERLLREKHELRTLLHSCDFQNVVDLGMVNLERHIGNARGNYSNYERISREFKYYIQNLRSTVENFYKIDFK